MFVPLRYIFIFCLACALHAQSLEPIKMQQEIASKETPLIFLNVKSALIAYLGTWQGEQDLFEPSNGGKTLASFSVTQTYEPSEDGGLSCMASVANSSGRNNISYSRIREVDGELVLSLMTGFIETPAYRGIVRGNSVLWFPYHMFYLLNVQEDKFFLKGKQLYMYSFALQHVYNPKKQYEGFLGQSAKYEKTQRIVEEPRESDKPSKPKKLTPILNKDFFKN